MLGRTCVYAPKQVVRSAGGRSDRHDLSPGEAICGVARGQDRKVGRDSCFAFELGSYVAHDSGDGVAVVPPDELGRQSVDHSSEAWVQI